MTEKPTPRNEGISQPPNQASGQDLENAMTLDLLGVSVYNLQHDFLELVSASKDATSGKALSKSSKIYEIENLQGPAGVIRKMGADVICPMDKKMGAAYVHSLHGEDHVGEATHMLSYSWSYSLGDIMDTLSDFCEHKGLNPKRTYIWICCLCVNQHRVVENSALKNSGMTAPPQVDFFAIFGERVKRIGHVLAMMAPWHSPVYITRVWCIFEIFTAHTTDKCKVDIVMPPKEKDSLEQDVIDTGSGVNALYATLGSTKVQDAKASVESDRLSILSQVESDVGYYELNNQVNILLRGWMHRTLTQLVESREITIDEEYVDFCNQVGVIVEKNGEPELAMKLHQAALHICNFAFSENHKSTATTYGCIGVVQFAVGDYDTALEMLQTALDIRFSVVGKNHPDTAQSFNDIGVVLEAMGDHEGALSKFTEAHSIRLSLLGKNHPDAAESCSNIGSVLDVMGDYEGAFSKFKEALAVEESVLGKNHPDVAHTHHNIGSVLSKMGDSEGALAKYRESLAIRLSVLGKKHPAVAATYRNMGGVLQQIGDYDGALSKYKEALVIQESVLGTDHPDTQTSLDLIEIANTELEKQST
ncbi:Kinesin light chain [Seminavis robusta]|uniref:Kinesin light chain n=1 Tax=Seminavis robusta TaxID=568900 RepID=A0A9N8E5P6_9STRA|nr:Kinesin light chain [Seminavis robusta]|eukprot:Sro690_g187580.1 Kinesin light chain (589) ;mRNA; r:11781-13547